VSGGAMSAAFIGTEDGERYVPVDGSVTLHKTRETRRP